MNAFYSVTWTNACMLQFGQSGSFLYAFLFSVKDVLGESQNKFVLGYECSAQHFLNCLISRCVMNAGSDDNFFMSLDSLIFFLKSVVS
jgi:hypothetical protein